MKTDTISSLGVAPEVPEGEMISGSIGDGHE